VTSQSLWSRGHDGIAISVYNTKSCDELNGEYLSCFSNQVESVSLRKCPCGHRLTDKAHLSAISMTDISLSFTYKMATEINWHRYGTKLRHCRRMYKGSRYSITERRVPELILVLGSQPASDVSHKPGGRLPLLSARPAVTPATLKRTATNFAAW